MDFVTIIFVQEIKVSNLQIIKMICCSNGKFQQNLLKGKRGNKILKSEWP